MQRDRAVPEGCASRDCLRRSGADDRTGGAKRIDAHAVRRPGERERDLEAASANEDRYAPWAETMLYEAGLRAARVVVMAAGYRIAADRGHVTAIDAADTLTSGRHHRIFVRFHRLRRRRNEFMYETSAEPGSQELATARADVAQLIAIARQQIPPP